MPRIELTNVTKRWNNFYAVEDLNSLPFHVSILEMFKELTFDLVIK